MTGWEVFACGAGGSVAVEVVTAYRYFSPPHAGLPAFYQSWSFYIVRVLLALVAGGLAVAYGINQTILAIHIGAATPLIVQTFSQTQPPSV